MKNHFARSLLCLASLGLIPAVWATPNPLSNSQPKLGDLEASMASVFQKESTAVVFKIAIPQSLISDRYYLVQILPQNKIRYLTVLGDDGILGDQKANDGVFSRKLQLNEKIPGKRTYAVIPASWVGSFSDRLALAPKTSIEVLGHPTFFQALNQAWNHWNNRIHSTN